MSAAVFVNSQSLIKKLIDSPGAWQIVLLFSGAGLNLIIQLLAVSVLGLEFTAIWGLGFALGLSFAAIVSYSIDPTINAFCKKSPRTSGLWLRASLRFRLLFIPPVFVLCLLLAWVSPVADAQVPYSPFLILCMLLTSTAMIHLNPFGVLLLLNDRLVILSSAIQISINTLGVAVKAWVLFSDFTVAQKAYAIGVILFIELLLHVIQTGAIALKNLNIQFRQNPARVSRAFAVLVTRARLYWVSNITYALANKVDQFIAPYFLSPTLLGVYVLGGKFIEVLKQTMTLANLRLYQRFCHLPLGSGLFAQTYLRMDRLQNYILLALAVFVLAVVPIVLHFVGVMQAWAVAVIGLLSLYLQSKLRLRSYLANLERDRLAGWLGYGLIGLSLALLSVSAYGLSLKLGLIEFSILVALSNLIGYFLCNWILRYQRTN